MGIEGNRAQHVAIIMDGNGRWAKRKTLPRVVGHRQGVEAVRALVRAVQTMDISCLTLYAFSSENWKRSEEEVDDLMNLMRKFIKTDLPEFVANNVRLKIIGNWRALESDIVALLDDALEQTKFGEKTLVVALNYGAQDEIVRAAEKALSTGPLSAQTLEAHLDTADLPPLDLLIRTSGEVRLSNFMLWQAAYAEMMFVDTLWPDFTPAMLSALLDDFEKRERRYGGR